MMEQESGKQDTQIVTLHGHGKVPLRAMEEQALVAQLTEKELDFEQKSEEYY